MTMNKTSHSMTGNALEFAAFRSNVAWLAVAAWVVANGVAAIALLWVVVNEPNWLMIT